MIMTEDESQTPAHRRRSGSMMMQVAGSRDGKGRQMPYYTRDEGQDGISEEPDAWPSGSDREMEDSRSDDEGVEDDEETGLTHTERKKRRRRKQKKQQRLDERIVGDGDGRSPEERLAAASMFRDTIINVLLIGLWYTFSISISVYNKWMFSRDNLDFHFPLFTTSIHMLVQFMLASAVLYFIPHFRSRMTEQAEYTQLDGAADAEQPSKPPSRPLMTRWFYLTRIGPCGTATALDIGLGNFSLRFISLTFFTMCKSSTLGMVLLFAFLFRLEKPTWKLCAIILVMTAGVIMMVAGEAAFNPLGFALVMSASFCSGFRWSLTQILLLRNAATSNPFSSIFFLTPVMFAALIVLAFPIEGPAALIDGFRALAAAKGAFVGTAIILFPGCLAFLMVAAEFALLKRTSVVTLSVCGIFKEVLTISAAGLIFGDELSPINVSGLVVTIASIAGYNYVKYSKMKQQAREEAKEILDESAEAVPLRYSSEQPDSTGIREDDRGGRESTSALIRDSLTLGTGIDGGAAKHLPNGVRENGVISSPVKRLEDLE